MTNTIVVGVLYAGLAVSYSVPQLHLAIPASYAMIAVAHLGDVVAKLIKAGQSKKAAAQTKEN